MDNYKFEFGDEFISFTQREDDGLTVNVSKSPVVIPSDKKEEFSRVINLVTGTKELDEAINLRNELIKYSEFIMDTKTSILYVDEYLEQLKSLLKEGKQ